MSMRCAFVIVGLAVFGGDAWAQIAPVIQERSVQTSASVSSGASDSDSDEASGFGPFISMINSNVSGANGAQASGAASQNSQISATSLTGLLNASVQVATGTTFVVGEADGGSNYLFIFNLAAATDISFSASGTLSYVGRNPEGEPSDLYGTSSVRLLNAITEEPIAGFTLFSEPGTDSASFEGTLPAGQYVIIARTTMHGYSADLIGPPNRSGSGNAHAEFSLDVDTGCSADFNGDTTVDFFDYLDFVDAFSSNNPIADFNEDGVIDFFDYLDFVDAFSAGC